MYAQNLTKKLMNSIPIEWLWVNLDCGLKTRGWPESIASIAKIFSSDIPTQYIENSLSTLFKEPSLPCALFELGIA